MNGRGGRCSVVDVCARASVVARIVSLTFECDDVNRRLLTAVCCNFRRSDFTRSGRIYDRRFSPYVQIFFINVHLDTNVRTLNRYIGFIGHFFKFARNLTDIFFW